MFLTRLRKGVLASMMLCLLAGPRPACAEDAPAMLDTDLRALMSRASELVTSLADRLRVDIQEPSVLTITRHAFYPPQARPSRAGQRPRPRKSVLAEYMARMRAIAPYAQITSDFDDFRPGRRHNGYDVGLDYGTPVPCGWAGRVTKITPWWGGQYGITVETNGIEVTYGHLGTNVKVGDQLQPGDIVGHIVWNHVDIKMYTCRGYVDFAKVDPFNDPVLTELHVKAKTQVTEAALAATTAPHPRVTYQQTAKHTFAP